MANWKAGMNNDAAGALGCVYNVFLNFRGYDTRHNFTDFLYDRLVDAGVRVFRDEEELPHGDVISNELEHAINNSIIYIPIFSQNYASSKWCLRELKLMIDNVSNSRDQKSILPIFLLVKPDDVKLKTRSDREPLYKAALEEHKGQSPKEVEAWKTALAKVDDHKGWVVENNTSQAWIVKSVVKEVLQKLKIKQKLVTEKFVGLDDQINYLTNLLDVNHDDVQLIGIYGMGGIGKTTIAMVIFNQLCSHFGKHCSFLEGVREWSTKDGMVPLQKKLLSDIGGSGSMGEISDSEEGMRRIGATLSNKKVLIVLDDVDKTVPIKKLIGNSKLYRGSRIIITTRDIDILQIEGFDIKIKPYEMQTMDDGHALQLFCEHAFCKDCPLDYYWELSRKFVSLMGGLPLAIKVVGSLLKNKEDKEFWEKTLVELGEVPKEEILETLRISYNDLDKFQKNIFLDIACFFFNKKKTNAIYMWESCKMCPTGGIEVLTKRCLIKILDNNKFWMHDQLIALGRKIVCENNQGDLRKQSRLWIAEEALQILGTKKEKHKVQALEIRRGPFQPIEITNEEFQRLPNLRFLKLHEGTFVGDFATCCSNLRWFSWHSHYQEEFRANNMYLDHLIVCKLDGICFKDESKAWDLIKRARDLRVLSITRCTGITTIPNLSKCLGLKSLTLAWCHYLERIESFIGDLQLLIELKIEHCKFLTVLPEEVGKLVKLKHFSLSGCAGLRELPSLIGNLTSLTELNLSDTMIRELPNSIGKLKSLRILRFPLKFSQENHDWELPSGISRLVNLEELDLSRRNVIGEIPDGIGEFSFLRILNLECTHISGVPRTINMLHHLQKLSLRSELLRSVPNLSNLTNLVELQLSDGSRSTGKSKLITGCNLMWIGRLSKLKKLVLNLLNIHVPPELASLSHLEELELSFLDLKPLGQHPSSDWSWRNLSTLEFYWCEVKDIPLDGLPRLEKLTLDGCKLLQKLSIPSELRKLREAQVSKCPELLEIQVSGFLESLESLSVVECKSLTKIVGLSYLKKLVKTRIERCNALTDVVGLNELESLRYLWVKGCTSLRRLIDASCTNIPGGCRVYIKGCGDFIKDSSRIDVVQRRVGGYPFPTKYQYLLDYRKGSLLDTSKFEPKSNKVQHLLHQYRGNVRECTGLKIDLF